MPDNNGVQYTNPPQSRNEAIVEAIIDGTEYTDPPQSENEEILVSILNKTSYEKPPKSRFSDLLLKLKEFIEGGGGGRPKVPQTGTWQFKTTPTKGYIIIGHDDDTRDSAKFVRMVNGYGFPVVLNSVGSSKNAPIDADTDNEYYPSGTVSQFPNGGTIGDLNAYIVANPSKGEVALHGWDADKVWDSALLTGGVLDTMYNTYTTGGGTKTKEEMKEAIMETYASTDVSQGASVVMQNRLALEEAIGTWVYTIGMWGGSHNFVVDGITVGNTNAVNCGTQKISRAQNFMGDSLLSGIGSNSPYWIYRKSDGLTSAVVGTILQGSYNEKNCTEGFQHYWLTTDERWADFKETLDTIKEWVDDGKIEVVTRKGYYDLGEWVANPIVALKIVPDAIAFQTGSTVTEANFTCKAVLEDSTEVVCQSDRILDISAIDTTQEGSYTVRLEYRGKVVEQNVLVLDYVPQSFILENGSFSGDSMTRNLSYCNLETPITYQANKTYRILYTFKANTNALYSVHYINFDIADDYTAWRTSQGQSVNPTNPVTVATCSITIQTSAGRTLDQLIRVTGLQNTTINEWAVTGAYVWEVPT